MRGPSFVHGFSRVPLPDGNQPVCWIAGDRDIYVHADRKAPRCLPCGYEDPLMHRPWETTVPQPSWNATPVRPFCLCRPELAMPCLSAGLYGPPIMTSALARGI